MKKILFLAILTLISFQLFAQQTQPVEMADQLRASGKIYVVIATIVIVFIGLAAYLFAIDSRLKKVEKNK